MISVLHISTECYPAAKAGGMGDVVGALPVYSAAAGINANVVIPKYTLPWFNNHKFKVVYKSSFLLDNTSINFTVEKNTSPDLDYPFYCIDLPGLFDRKSVYLGEDGEGFKDEIERNISFQRAVLLWLNSKEIEFDVIHCHDHQTGLIPFFVKHGKDFKKLREQATYYTIHNAAYRGNWDWKHKNLLPAFNEDHRGLLDWDDHIHSFATGIKNCWAYSTVSPSYLKEISTNSGNLNWLFSNTKDKSRGILNGIDNETWNPATDPLIGHHLKRSWSVFKSKNKAAFCKEYKIDIKAPIFSFIGRFAYQKGADILAQTIESILSETKNINFVILGNGDKNLENQFQKLKGKYTSNVHAFIMYDETLSHKIYAASDFLIMPSRFEPCGLNQMFAYRYATIPIVRSTGGLIDTVDDIDNGGCGIRFENPNVIDLKTAITRALTLYSDPEETEKIRLKSKELDFSWLASIKLYKEEYLKLLNQ